MKYALTLLIAIGATVIVLESAHFGPAIAAPANAQAATGISMNDLPLKYFFNESFDLQPLPSTSGGTLFNTGRKITDTVPADQAILVKNIVVRSTGSSGFILNDLNLFGLVINGKPVYRGDGLTEFSDILLRPGDTYTFEFGGVSSSKPHRLIITGYAFDADLLY